jgi:hypothetical protein
MKMYACRWPNGDLSFVGASSKEEAKEILYEEVDDPAMLKMIQLSFCNFNFKLVDGEFEFESIHGESYLDIIERLYPEIHKANMEAEDVNEAPGNTSKSNLKDERINLSRNPGERYGLKNGSGEYLCVCIQGQRTTLDVNLAAKLNDPMMLDYILEMRLIEDPSWRVVRILDKDLP